MTLLWEFAAQSPPAAPGGTASQQIIPESLPAGFNIPAKIAQSFRNES